jgi:hypothetical protein
VASLSYREATAWSFDPRHSNGKGSPFGAKGSAASPQRHQACQIEFFGFRPP